MNAAATARPALADLVRTLRPSQWTKNFVVPAALFFALGDPAQPVTLSAGPVLHVLAAALLFCVVSSGIYVFNDLRDVVQDRLHPLKRLRPIAAGRVSPQVGWTLAALLLAAGLTGALLVSLRLVLVLGVYAVLQVIYTLWLKQVALLDVLLIASGFVLRALAGAVVADVYISPWLLICAFLLALFLALCKRRHEKITLEDAAENHRAALEHYDQRLLDQLIAIVSAATLVCYAIYTLWPETVDKFGTHALSLTIPFVLFGLFRYLDLVYRHEQGGHPERTLLTDWPLLVNLALYGVCVLVIFALTRPQRVLP